MEGAKMKSKLCTYSNITNNHSQGRGGNRVCKITPHYMAAHWTGRQCADYFASTSRQASSNYCIGYDGDIAMSVDEVDRAWTSASRWNDERAITIECANNSDSSLTDATWKALVLLCSDICRRYGFRLTYDGTRNATLTEHRMFYSTDCPGAWLHARMEKLAAEVNTQLDGSAEPISVPSAPKASDGISDAGFQGIYVCNTDSLNVRTEPSLSGEIVAAYSKGDTVKLDGWYSIADGYVWGRYTGYSGNTRYIAVGKPTGGYDASDFLVKEHIESGAKHSAGTYRIVCSYLNVRTGAGIGYKSVAHYNQGETVVLDGMFVEVDGYVWGRYTGGSGYKRWIAIETSNGEMYAEKL